MSADICMFITLQPHKVYLKLITNMLLFVEICPYLQVLTSGCSSLYPSHIIIIDKQWQLVLVFSKPQKMSYIQRRHGVLCLRVVYRGFSSHPWFQSYLGLRVRDSVFLCTVATEKVKQVEKAKLSVYSFSLEAMLRTMEHKMISVSSTCVIHIKHHHESKRFATREGGYSERAPGVRGENAVPSAMKAACCPITYALVS